MQVNAPVDVRESGIQQLLLKKKLKSDVKLLIVTNCETVVQSPETHMASLRELVKLFESSKIMSLKEIRVILTASLCVVFKDILPSYHIRNLTEPEKSQQMKKETKKLRFFEENLLVNYRKYTDVLRTILSSATSVGKSTRGAKCCKIAWNDVDRVTALRAACQLLEAHPRFNFSEELVQSVLPYLNSTSEKLSSIVFNTFKTVFANDREGEASLSICKAIHAFWRKMSYRLRPAVARILSLVPIKDVADPNSTVGSKRDRKLLSRRERKVSPTFQLIISFV
ncbi:Nucleolar complex-associated protein [Paragonimus heterotremus]|uniref:Nucleolar complex-associated protein n=1 Tax=Paragonimus heterotremus TaxID=100268 RepID=A0A8J4T5P7_9TREM|nr:Nucleolar complex-associated protein [Paragonimus heterotremus]